MVSVAGVDAESRRAQSSQRGTPGRAIRFSGGRFRGKRIERRADRAIEQRDRLDDERCAPGAEFQGELFGEKYDRPEHVNGS